MDFGPLLILAILIIIGLVLKIKKGGQKPTNPHRRKLQSTQARYSTDQFAEHWQRIEQTMAMPGLENTKAAIFEADKLLDAALRQSGIRGETMGERLKNARQHFGNNAVYQGLWEAHKVRNALAHEVGFDVPKVVGQQHLSQFKSGLQYLRMLK